MSDSQVFIFATLKPQSGKEAGAKTFLQGMCAPSRAEEGCIFYNLYSSQEDSGTFHFFECWRNQSALDAHREMPHYKKFRENLEDLMEGPPKAQILQAVNFEF